MPVDYKNPKSETFEIYSWFASDYDENLPTVVYLIGGPGQGSHWGQSALESKKYNLLLMDQRGVALSKPASIDLYLNPQLYKSEWTARDLETIRKKLKISKLSVYAISYGTIPATIYASLFPDQTKALVLEGTAYSAKHLASFTVKKKLIKQALAAQTVNVEKMIQNLKTEPDVNTTWFFQWARDTLLLNDGETAVSEQLAKLQDPAAYLAFVEVLKSQYKPRANDFTNDLYNLNEVAYYMFFCQELGLAKRSTQTDLSFRSTQIVEIRNSNFDQICQSLNARSEKDYQARSFAVRVPVTYFQGQNDPATEMPGAFLHFQNVARASKQLLILKNGGHNPNIQALAYDLPAQIEMLEKALTGQRITQDLVNKANQADLSLQWNLINK